MKDSIAINKKKEKFAIVLMIFYIITSLFPPFYYYVHIPPSLLMGVFEAGMVLLFPRLLITIPMLVLYVYTIILFVYHMSGNSYFSDVSRVIMPFLTFSCPIFLCEAAYKYVSRQNYKYIVFSTSIVLSAIILISIPSWLVNPLIMRGASVNATGDGAFDKNFYYWVVDYGIIHQVFILIPVLLFLIRTIDKRHFFLRGWWIVFLALLFFIIYAANAGAVFVLSIILLFSSLWFRGKTINTSVIIRFIIFIIILLAVYYFNVIPLIIQFIQNFMPSHSYSAEKLEEIKVFFLTGETEGDLGNRSDFYSDSLSLFFESPLMGTDNPKAIGNHSFLFDQLALLGVFGVIPLITLYKVQLQRVFNTLHNTKLIFVLAAFSYLVMLIFKYSFGNIFVFGLLPVFCWYGEYLTLKKNNI